MPREHYNNIRDANLFDILDSNRTRLIAAKLRNVPCGISEIPLEFHLKPKTVKKLSFHIPWGGMIYGYVHPKKEIQSKLGIKSEIKSAAISDWDGRFVLIFETENEADSIAYNISGNDVIRLLESCRHPSEY